MVNFMMAAVNKYCGDCMEIGEFLPLKFCMLNINSGMWLCPKEECIFPMASATLKDYMVDNLTTENILSLTGKKHNLETKVTSPALSSATNSCEKVSSLNIQAVNGSCSSSSHVNSDQVSAKTISVISNEDNNSVYTDSISGSFCSEVFSTMGKRKVTDMFPLWENEELLCWLDSMLGVLILNTTIKETLRKYAEEVNTMLSRFFTEYEKIFLVFRQDGKYSNVKEMLQELRSTILRFLHPKMLSNFNEEDSPLFSIQLVIKTSKKVYEDMEWEYQSDFTCTQCDFQRKDGFRKMILSLPNASSDFNLLDNLYYTRACYRCEAEGQKSKYIIERYPSALFVHFEQGLRLRNFWNKLNFTTPSGEMYIVTEIVQYISKRKHFVLWAYSHKDTHLLWPFILLDDLHWRSIFMTLVLVVMAAILVIGYKKHQKSEIILLQMRDIEKLWIEVDDLKEPVVNAKYRRPRCRPDEVHFMVWEKVSILNNTLPKPKDSIQNTCNSTNVLDADLDSPPSGNSSIMPVISGLSSRATSLSSSDGISPASAPTSNTHTNQPTGDQLQLRGALKQRFLHVPRYKPYVPRSKKNRKLNKDSTMSVLNPVEENKNTLTQNSLESTTIHTPSTFQIETNESTVNTDFLNEMSDVISQEIDDFYEEMVLRNTSKPNIVDTDEIFSSEQPIAEVNTIKNISNLLNLSDIDIDIDDNLPNTSVHVDNSPNTSSLDLVDFNIENVSTEIKISDDELEEILNG